MMQKRRTKKSYNKKWSNWKYHLTSNNNQHHQEVNCKTLQLTWKTNQNKYNECYKRTSNNENMCCRKRMKGWSVSNLKEIELTYITRPYSSRGSCSSLPSPPISILRYAATLLSISSCEHLKIKKTPLLKNIINI